MSLEKLYEKGIINRELLLGVVISIESSSAKINLSSAGFESASHYLGYRYGKGEVGEFVLIEGQRNLLFGRISEIKIPENERKTLTQSYQGANNLDAIGTIRFLGSVSLTDLSVTAGVESYPRIGDRVYSAPQNFISKIPLLFDLTNKQNNEVRGVLLNLGSVEKNNENIVEFKPEKLFGRHCAILGATGGGKSWTTARLIDECLKYNSKMILFDPTGEYRDFKGDQIQNLYLGEIVNDKIAEGAISCSLPYSVFTESDFLALFQPSPGVQLPKLRDAIISLRAVKKDPACNLIVDGKLETESDLLPLFQPTPGVQPPELRDAIISLREVKKNLSSVRKDPACNLIVDGKLKKAKKSIENVSTFLKKNAPKEENAEFDIFKLSEQIKEECVWPSDKDSTIYGGYYDKDYGYCTTLISRIETITKSKNMHFIFNHSDSKYKGGSLIAKIKGFIENEDHKLLVVNLSGVSYEFQTREIVANAIGRSLLKIVRAGELNNKPLLVLIDEAHSFIGKYIGSEETVSKLDAFELIAKEGRKYGLNVCLITQRPRDITEGVLSQIGTLIVHRLTNDRDREVVERACGEIDRYSSAFIPNLKPGEAAVIGVDFPIPLTINISTPETKPKSDGPNYQHAWFKNEENSQNS